MFCRAKKKLPLYTLVNERLKELFLNKHFTVLSPTASTQLFKYLVSQSIRWELFLGTAKHPFVTNCLGMVRSPQNCRSISGRHNRLTSFLSSSVLIFMLLRFHEILMVYKRTTDTQRDLFLTFGLGQTFWTDFFLRHLGYFRPDYQLPFWNCEFLVHVFHYSIIISKKTKPLYPTPKYLFGIIYLGVGFDFGSQRI